jgi:hypothetical protein
MREVADTDGMAVGDVASEDADTVEWNDIDGTPMEHIRGHVRPCGGMVMTWND